MCVQQYCSNSLPSWHYMPYAERWLSDIVADTDSFSNDADCCLQGAAGRQGLSDCSVQATGFVIPCCVEFKGELGHAREPEVCVSSGFGGRA